MIYSQGNDRKPGEIPAGKVELILASASPRRRELLKKIVHRFYITPSNIKEKFLDNEAPDAYVMRVSREKAEAVSGCAEPGNGGAWVIAGDTVVVLEGKILGKPQDPDHARWMLVQLQDRMHEVVSGICLLNRGKEVCCVEAVRTRVWMTRIEPEEIEAYLETGEPFDKAGGYAIQGRGGRFIHRIEGSYDNVVGLPTERLRVLLKTYNLV